MGVAYGDTAASPPSGEGEAKRRGGSSFLQYGRRARLGIEIIDF